MQPRHGGRLELRLVRTNPSVTYAVTLFRKAEVWKGEAQIEAETGAVHFSDWQGEGPPPSWLKDAAKAQLRTLRNTRAVAGWPRRLTRWRSAPAGSDE